MRRYLLFLCAFFLGLMGFVASVSRVIDPYDYWGTPKFNAINIVKPRLHQHLITAKTRQYQRIKPHTVLIGNSRVEVGLDPNADLWPAEYRPVYNFGLPGHSLRSILRYFKSAVPSSQPSRLFIGIDFLDFLTVKKFESDENSELREARAKKDSGLNTGFGERIEMLVTLDAFKDSIITISEQYDTHPRHVNPYGFNPLMDYEEILRFEGHYAIFEQRNVDYTRRQLSHDRQFILDTDGMHPAFNSLQAFLDWARERHMEVVLFTYPYHVDLRLMIADRGFHEDFEEWKRQLTALAETFDVILWDFANLHNFTQEEVPAAGNTDVRLNWYWEAGHFKAALGNEMVKRMLNTAGANQTFGVVLTLKNLEAQLVKDRARLHEYRMSHPSVVERIATISGRTN